MGYGDPDAYNQPEHFGLTPIGELDDSGGYDFDILAVWQHEDGRIFYATDSGCSCPTPFEDYTSLDTLTPLTEQTWDAFKGEVDSFAHYSEDGFGTEQVSLLAKTLAYLRQPAPAPSTT